MSHHIYSGQLDGEHTQVLAYCNNKKLVGTLTITTHRFHIEEYYHFHVYHNGNIVHSSSRLQLAIKVYNNLDNTSSKKTGIEPVEAIPETDKNTTSICTKCDHQDHCNRWLRNPEVKISSCVSFNDLM